MRKYFTKLLFVAACLLCSVNALAYDFEVDGIYYNIVSAEELTCEVTWGKYTGDISIPKDIEYEGKTYSVTSIGYNAFSNCGSLVSVDLPSSLTSIGDQAFWYCRSLVSVDLPSSLTSIGRSAFQGCSNILSIVIPNSVTSIGENAFCACDKLASVVIGSGVTSVNEIFSRNSQPAKVVWLPNTPPEGYDSYDRYNDYYRNCGKVNYVANDSYNFSFGTRYTYDQLSSMFEVDGVIYIPVSLSERTCDIIDCSYSEKANKMDLKRTVIYKGVTMNLRNFREYAFYDNDFIKGLTIDIDGDIPEYAFYSCDNIPEVKIGSSITSIGDYAFSNCISLSQIHIVPNITSIGNYAFYGCSKIGDITIEDRETDLQLGSNGIEPLFSSCPLDEVYIGGKIVYNTGSDYGYSPFYRNKSLRTVTITDKETTIYDNEFYGCTGLKNVKIGDGVTSFGKYAFSGCSAIESFEFGAHVETIGEEAFSDCTSMTKMTSHNPVPPTCGTEALDDINKWECTLYVPETAVDSYKAADQWKEFVFVESFSPTGIANVPVETTGKTEAARYDMSGNRVSDAYKGVVIIKYTDGTRTKALVR